MKAHADVNGRKITYTTTGTGDPILVIADTPADLALLNDWFQLLTPEWPPGPAHHFPAAPPEAALRTANASDHAAAEAEATERSTAAAGISVEQPAVLGAALAEATDRRAVAVPAAISADRPAADRPTDPSAAAPDHTPDHLDRPATTPRSDVTALAVLIEHLALGPVRLLAWGETSQVALRLTVERPELVRRLAVIGPLPACDVLPGRTGLATLATLTTPLLILQGDDEALDIAHSAALTRTVPDGRLAVLPGPSYLLPAAKPDLVGLILLEFFEEDAPLRRSTVPPGVLGSPLPR